MARKPDDRFDDDEALVVENLGAKLRRTAGRVPFIDEAVASFYAARDPQTPAGVKAAVMAALYLLPLAYGKATGAF